MPPPPPDAPLEDSPKSYIHGLATLYDRFAYALDPFSPERDEAERIFEQDIASLYDGLPTPKPSLHDFRKDVILRCKAYLKAGDKTSSL
jgi:hypothetical protein